MASERINYKIKYFLQHLHNIFLFFFREKETKFTYCYECIGTFLLVAKFDFMPNIAKFINVKFDSLVKGNGRCYCLRHNEG